MKILKAADAFDKSAKIDQEINTRSILFKKRGISYQSVLIYPLICHLYT